MNEFSAGQRIENRLRRQHARWAIEKGLYQVWYWCWLRWWMRLGRRWAKRVGAWLERLFHPLADSKLFKRLMTGLGILILCILVVAFLSLIAVVPGFLLLRIVEENLNDPLPAEIARCALGWADRWIHPDDSIPLD